MLKGDTGENLIGLLERRLDAVIYRAKFATTIFSARQLINHGHVKVNGKKVNIGSYLVREEDSIEIRDKSKQLAIIDIALANKERETPEYIQMDEKNKKLKFVRVPKFEEVPYPIVMEPNLVIEYYSRSLAFSFKIYIFTFKKFCQFTTFIHFFNNITSTYEFIFNIKLWDGWPIRIGFDAFTDAVIFKYVNAPKFHAKMR